MVMLIAIGTILGIVACAWWWASRAENRRTEEVAHAVREWQLGPGTDSAAALEAECGRLLGELYLHGRVTNCWIGRVRGLELTLFDWSFTMRYGTSSRSYHQTTVQIDLPESSLTERLVVRPIDLSFRLWSKEQQDQMRLLVPPDFAKTHFLESSDIRRVGLWLHAGGDQTFSDAPKRWLLCGGCKMTVFEQNRLVPVSGFGALLNQSLHVAERWLDLAAQIDPSSMPSDEAR